MGKHAAGSSLSRGGHCTGAHRSWEATGLGDEGLVLPLGGGKGEPGMRGEERG